MNLIRINQDQFEFHLSKRKKRWLIELLDLYPVLSGTYQQLSHITDAPNLQEAQQWLHEALAAHHQETKKQIQGWLNDPGRFAEISQGYRLNLKRAEIDWLLQVLNDIRVGNWVILGSPETSQFIPAPSNAKQANNYWAMELCGLFQSVLLQALDQGR